MKTIAEMVDMRRVAVIMMWIAALGLANEAAVAQKSRAEDRSETNSVVYSWAQRDSAFIKLREDGTFEFAWYGCVGWGEHASGSYRRSKTKIKFQTADTVFDPSAMGFAKEMNRLYWGQREYLIPEERMLEFVNAINAGEEPRLNTRFGYFYLRDSVEVKEFKGFPNLPVEWQSYLLPRPISGLIRRVEQRETARQRPIAIIDAGAQVGLKKGMRLFAYNPRRPSLSADLEVTEVFADSARVMVPLQYNHIRRMDTWSSWKPKNFGH